MTRGVDSAISLLHTVETERLIAGGERGASPRRADIDHSRLGSSRVAKDALDTRYSAGPLVAVVLRACSVEVLGSVISRSRPYFFFERW